MTCQNCGSQRVGADGVCANCGWSAPSLYGTMPMMAAPSADSGATREANVVPRATPAGMGLPGMSLPRGNGQGLLSRAAASNPSLPPREEREADPIEPDDDTLDEVPPEDEIEDFCGNCGAPIQHGRTFCGQCGAPVTRGSLGQTTASARHVAYPSPQPWRSEDREAPTIADMQFGGGAAASAGTSTTGQRALRIGLGILCLLGSIATAVLAISQFSQAFR